MALSVGVDDVVVVDIHGVSGRGLPLVKWGLPLSVPEISGMGRFFCHPRGSIGVGLGLLVYSLLDLLVILRYMFGFVV